MHGVFLMKLVRKIKKACLKHLSFNHAKINKKSPNGLFFNGGADAYRFELLVNRFTKHLLTPNAYRTCSLIEKLRLVM